MALNIHGIRDKGPVPFMETVDWKDFWKWRRGPSRNDSVFAEVTWPALKDSLKVLAKAFGPDRVVMGGEMKPVDAQIFGAHSREFIIRRASFLDDVKIPDINCAVKDVYADGYNS